MPLIRTPDERFHNLPDYPFQPHYVEVNGARMHYVDEGAGEVILCLHGEPSWSFLYRKMIPSLSQHHRVIAPDFIGFGKSDKYTEREAYSFQMHRDMLVGFLDTLALDQITLVCQDWGGLIGLRVATELPERFARLVIMNTGLPAGIEPMPEAYHRWRAMVASSTDLAIDTVIQVGVFDRKNISDEVLAAYNAPFPDVRYKAGALTFPLLVPVERTDPGADAMLRAREVLKEWQKPVLVMFSDKDPITRGADKWFRKLIPTAQDQPEITIHEAGHFLQEEKGGELAQHILDFIARS